MSWLAESATDWRTTIAPLPLRCSACGREVQTVIEGMCHGCYYGHKLAPTVSDHPESGNVAESLESGKGEEES